MDENQYKSLTISGKKYIFDELELLTKKRLSNTKLPPWEKSLYEFITQWINSESTIRVKTSGSTGSEKWIEVEKEKMISSAEITGRFFSFQEKDKALLCLPVDFIAGKMMVVRAFVSGLNLVSIEPSTNPLKNQNESFDFVAMTPMQVQSVLRDIGGFEKLNKIKILIIGGGNINSKLLSQIEKLKNNTFHTYGMTETLTHVALKKLNGKNKDRYFKALPGVEFSKDERDCLVISAPHLSDEPIVTNDIVALIDNKSFSFKGRFDNVINSGGIKISPEEVEYKLKYFIENRFIIAGIQDDLLGQRLVLIIEGEMEKNLSIEEISKKVQLSKYEIPKEIYFLPLFLETKNGKVIRSIILQQLANNG